MLGFDLICPVTFDWHAIFDSDRSGGFESCEVGCCATHCTCAKGFAALYLYELVWEGCTYCSSQCFFCFFVHMGCRAVQCAVFALEAYCFACLLSLISQLSLISLVSLACLISWMSLMSLVLSDSVSLPASLCLSALPACPSTSQCRVRTVYVFHLRV